MSALLRSFVVIRRISLCRHHPLIVPYRLLSSTPVRLQSSSIASRVLYPFQRIHYFFKNDPFAKVSVIFGGVVLSILLVIEAFTKTAQKVKPQIMVTPPQCSHALVTRSKEMNTLIKCLPSLTSIKQCVAVITGPSGSGKTVLATQLAQHFANGGRSRIPFLSRSRKPVILSVDGTNLVTLDYTLRYAASCLDIPSHELYQQQPAEQLPDNTNSQLLHFFNSIFTKLSSQKNKWLLVIDGVEDDEVVGVVNAALSSSATGSRRGCIVVTSNHSNHLPSSVQVSLDAGLTDAESSTLIHTLVGCDDNNDNTIKLIQQLNNEPLALSLAGLTVKLYSQFLEAADPMLSERPFKQAFSSFCEVLSSKLSQQPSRDELVTATTQLYIEALSAADPFFLHTIDFLSSTNPSLPVPQSAISQHLSHPFYQLSSYTTQFLSPLADPLEPASPTPSPPSYFEMIKSKIPFIPQSSSPLPAASGGQQALQKLAEAQTGRWALPDPLTSLIKSPFIKSQSFSGLKLVSMHRSVVECIHDHFLSYTVPKLEENHLRGAKTQFDKGSWFKQFRSFDEDSVLAGYLKALPGLGEGGVMTEEQFKSASSRGTYSQYLHAVSHNHRMVAALTNELKYLSRDAEDLLLCRYIQPHLTSLSLSPLLPANDQLKCQNGLLSIEAAFSPKSEAVYVKYNAILQAEQQAMDSPSVANTLTQMAELKYHSGDLASAEQLLLSAVAIHNKVSRKNVEQSLDCGMSMSLLGLVYAAQGKKQLTKDYLERSLSLYQAVPVNGEVPRKQRKMVASTVTDLGHAYVSLGNVIMAKRYLELALTAHRNIHPTGTHPEVTRTLTVMSVVHALMGDHVESKRLRKEAQGPATVLTNVL